MATVKVAQLAYTTAQGKPRSVFVAYGGLETRWRTDNNNVLFDAYVDDTEYMRGIGAVVDTFKMSFTHAEVLTAFALEGNAGEVLSNAFWALAQTKKFIPDWSEIPETDAAGETIPAEQRKRKMNLKSLSDLGAQIFDVELG